MQADSLSTAALYRRFLRIHIRRWIRAVIVRRPRHSLDTGIMALLGARRRTHRLLVRLIHAGFLCAMAVGVAGQSGAADLFADLQWLAAARGPPAGSNTAAIITCGNVGLVTSPVAGTSYIPMSLSGVHTPSQSTEPSGTPDCTALLANGCIMDSNERFGRMAVTPAAPFVCPPIGLGSRFLSVLRGPSYFGGVTDTGALVLHGLGSSWNRCAFVRGPFTPMATAQRLFVTRTAGQAMFSVAIRETVDLCALDVAGVLRCWDTIPSSWASTTPVWVPAAVNATARPASSCRDITGVTTLLTPSPRLCPNQAAAYASAFASGNATAIAAAVAAGACAAPFALASFSVSPCAIARPSLTGGTYIIGVRSADLLPVAWLVGSDTWEAPPPPNSTAVAPIGMFTASRAPIPVDWRFPPLWRCGDPDGNRVFVGRALDGTYWTEPEIREQGIAAASRLSSTRRVASAWQVHIRPTPSTMEVYSYAVYDGLPSSTCGPYAPFASVVASNAWNDICGGCGANQPSAGIRTRDGSVQFSGHQQSHLLPASPIQIAPGTLVMRPGADIVCAAFAAPVAVLAAEASAAGSGQPPPLPLTWDSKCAGWVPGAASASVPVWTIVQGVPSFSYGLSWMDDPAPRCMDAPPTALAVSRNFMATAVTSFFDTTTGRNNQRVCTNCVMFYGGAGAAAAVPTGTIIRNARALVLQPVNAAWVCALVGVGAINGSRGLFCAGSTLPATVADRPPGDASVPLSLLATSSTTICTSIATSGALWCFANDISTVLSSAAAAGITTTVPAGADAGRAALLQVNVTALSASEALVCFVYDVGSAGPASQLACLGPSSDPVMQTAQSSAAAAGFSMTQLGVWAASRGGSAAPVALVSIAVGNAAACVLSAMQRIWCWGAAASATAIADANADAGRYITIAVGGTSVCAAGVDGRLRCFGALQSFIQDGAALPPAYGNLTVATAAPGEVNLPLALAGVSVYATAMTGDDSQCNCSAATPCATLAGALRVGAACVAASAGSQPSLTIWVDGRVDAVPGASVSGGTTAVNASTLPLAAVLAQQSLLLLRLAGANGGGTIVMPRCASFPSGSAASNSSSASSGSSTPTVCLPFSSFSLPRLVVQDLVLETDPAASVSAAALGTFHCDSVLASAVPTWLTNVSFAGWNCSGPIVSLTAANTTADASFALARAQSTTAASPRTQDAAAFMGASFSTIAGASFTNCAATAGVLARALPALRASGIAAEGCAFESALAVDQALLVQLDGLRLVAPSQQSPLATAAAAAAARASALLPGSRVCGNGVRINSVGVAVVSGIVTVGVRLPASSAGGAGVCITDWIHASTRSSAPRPSWVTIDGVRADDCAIGDAASGAASQVGGASSSAGAASGGVVGATPAGGGCAVRVSFDAAIWLSALSIANVQVTRSAVAGDGAGVSVDGASSVSLSNVTCSETFAGGAGGGGCIAVQGFSAVALSAVVATKSAASYAGGAVYLRAAGPSSNAAVRYSEFTDAAALRGSGGALAVVGASAVTVANVRCTGALAQRGSGLGRTLHAEGAQEDGRGSSADLLITTAHESEATPSASATRRQRPRGSS